MYTVKGVDGKCGSLAGCHRLKYRGDGTLFQNAYRVNPTSSDDEDGIFKSALVLSRIFLLFSVLIDDVILKNLNAKEFSDNFPSTFCQSYRIKPWQKSPGS
jgi:hypothetical protein